MKPFIFLLFLSILLVQLANAGNGKEASTSEKTVTYTELVAKVYEKSKAYVDEIPFISFYLLGHLNFMINIVDRIIPIQEKFLVHPDRFLEEKNAKWIPTRIPKGLKYSDCDAKSLLTSRIEAIGRWINIIKNLYKDIFAEISAQPPNKVDKEFDDAYKQWYKNRPSKSHTQLIMDKLPAMRQIHNIISHKFTTKLNEANELEKSIDKDIKEARSKCESMALTQEPSDVSETIEFLNLLPSKYAELDELLQKLRDYLEEYNRARLNWAEVLIGMTKEIGGVREPVLPSKSTVGRLTQAATKNLNLGKQKGKKEEK